jgi:hypothetical protein
MKSLRLWIAVGIFCLVAGVGSAALSHAQEGENRGFAGGSYLVTTNDSQGNFASRTVITLHGDQTMSVVDSNQGGPSYFFSGQLGSWKTEGRGAIVAKTIDFNYPPGPGVARLDYTLNLTQDNRQVAGTVTLRAFPLEGGDPVNGEGTVLGTFNFQGELINP